MNEIIGNRVVVYVPFQQSNAVKCWDDFVWVCGETGVCLKYRKSCSNFPLTLPHSLSLFNIPLIRYSRLDWQIQPARAGANLWKNTKCLWETFSKGEKVGGYKKAHFLHFSDCGLLLNYSPVWRAPKLIVLIYLSIFVNIRRANNEVLDQAGECEGLTFLISRVLAKIKKP